MDKTGLFTVDGTPVYTNDFIKDLRVKEEGKKNSNTFIAQEGPQEDDLHSNVDILITGGNRGGGKANSYGTPVITPYGYKRMGDLQIGDEICTPYEGIQRVSNIFEQGERKGYVITFDDGTRCNVLNSHRFWARLNPDENFREMEFKEILKHYMLNRKFPFSLRPGTHNYAEIPLCGRVQMQEDMTPLEMPIHPFVMGFISGSGYWKFSKMQGAACKMQGGVVLSKIHDCGYTYFKNANGVFMRGISEENADAVGMARANAPAKIPVQYMTGSIYTRTEYVRGAIAGYGGSHNHHPYLDTKNPRYAEEFAQICRSIGWWAKVADVTDDPEKIGYKRVLIIAPDDKDAFILGEYSKVARTNANMPYSPNCPGMLTKKIVSVRQADKQKYRCITVTGYQHLYLTDGFTVNHNTFTLLMEALYSIHDSHFNAILFRKEKDDFKNIIHDSRYLYSTLGRFNKSKDDMTWYFHSGAELKMSYFADPVDDFFDRFRGQQFSYIGIDEFTQIEYAKFKFLITCNRNAYHIPNRIIGTCNPDPLSWVRPFIDYWIGPDGLPIEERNGVIRYCYMKGDDVSQIVWGDTPEEVYLQCKDDIDKRWDPEYEKLGMDKIRTSVKSVTFIRAELKFNKKLLKSDPNYLGSLMNQSEESQARDLDGNWNFMAMGDDLIKMQHLIRCFNNPMMTGDKVKRASSDLAFTGGDNCVTWLWIGDHVADVFVCRLDSVATASAIKTKLQEWGVSEQNYTYDLNGLGQSFKGFFKHARPFNNRESVSQKYKGQFDTIKSQCAWIFADKILRGEISFEPSILTRRFSGDGYRNKLLSDILQDERKAIRQDASKADAGWCIIKKEQMKRIVGHSPDFMESLFMRYIFSIKVTQVQIPAWIRNF